MVLWLLLSIIYILVYTINGERFAGLNFRTYHIVHQIETIYYAKDPIANLARVFVSVKCYILNLLFSSSCFLRYDFFFTKLPEQ